MSDRSGSERLFRKASRENLLGAGENKRGEPVSAPLAKPSISPLMLVVVTVLDLSALLVLLTVSEAIGLIMLVISSAILALWMNLRLGAARRRREEKR